MRTRRGEESKEGGSTIKSLMSKETRFKLWLATNLRWLWLVLKWLQRMSWRLGSREKVFAQIYRGRRWGSSESPSGGSSTPAETAAIRADLRAQLLTVIALEQQCCGFLDFELTEDLENSWILLKRHRSGCSTGSA